MVGERDTYKRMLFFDTETTGISPGNICQLSYIIVEKEIIETKNFYFMVDYIEPEAERVHGLSVEMLKSLSNNETYMNRINEIANDFSEADVIVAHNLDFDISFMNAEFKRCKNNFRYNNGICTMKYFTEICRLPHYNRKGFKWPSLKELTGYLGITEEEIMNKTADIFKCQSIGYHDARFDISATYMCVMKAMEQGLIK